MKFSPWLIGAGLGYAVTFGAGLRSILATITLAEQVNRKAGPDQQVSAFNRSWANRRRMVALYRTFYPGGDLIRQEWFYRALMAAGMIGLVASLGRLE